MIPHILLWRVQTDQAACDYVLASQKELIATSVVENLFAGGVEPISDDKFRVGEKHFSTLTDLMAKDLGVLRENIVDFEMNLCDS